MKIEALLKEALAPVEPPYSTDELLGELQGRLLNWADAAQSELEGWELSAMRDPRNWGRPAAAVAVTATAGTAVVLLRLRQSHTRRVSEADGLRDLAGRTLADMVEETRRIL